MLTMSPQGLLDDRGGSLGPDERRRVKVPPGEITCDALDQRPLRVGRRRRRPRGTAANLASRATALGAPTYSALSAALTGQTIFVGALDGLAGSPLVGAVVQMDRGVMLARTWRPPSRWGP